MYLRHSHKMCLLDCKAVLPQCGQWADSFWEETKAVFTCRGMICDGVDDAAQVAWVPFGHIVEEIVHVLGCAVLEDFLLLTYGEPLGAPVRVI